MTEQGGGLVGRLMELPVFEAQWVLWLLILLSVLSVAVIVERLVFFYQHRVNGDTLRQKLDDSLSKGDFEAGASALKQYDSMETNHA